jgi:hypothetical protein
LCTKYGLEFASLNRLGETTSVLTLLDKFFETLSKFFLSGWVLHVNGATKVGGSKKDFYWISAPNINLEKEEWAGSEPNNLNNNELCLSIRTFKKRSSSKLVHGFNDVTCNAVEERTLCEKTIRKV